MIGAADVAVRDARDLADRTDVETLVRTFYARAFEDPLLGHVFLEIARLDLDAHLPVMCDFWDTALFRAGLYRRNAFEVHARLHAKSPLTAAHFRRWLELWVATTDALFTGPRAETAKIQAGRIAWAISRRLLGSADDALLAEEPRRALRTHERDWAVQPGGGRP
ncbi:MAG TPA: group III truncated hemoglobin [Sporichthya sp.]|nr:group III truncated hemoglobin [Sporichthya sp.]